MSQGYRRKVVNNIKIQLRCSSDEQDDWVHLIYFTILKHTLKQSQQYALTW